MNEPVIIALSGKKGSGKNTIASHLVDSFAREYKGPRNGVPFCITLAFADSLKGFCIDVLGLSKEQCYGTDDEKNTSTRYNWMNTPPMYNDLPWGEGFMTGRQVMQIFGTECVRQWFGNVWAEATIRKILKEQPALAIVTDNRFPSEVDAILGHSKGYVIRLTRSPYEQDEHESEIALDDYNWDKENCYVLDNGSLSIEEQNSAVDVIFKDIFHQEFGQ